MMLNTMFECNTDTEAGDKGRVCPPNDEQRDAQFGRQECRRRRWRSSCAELSEKSQRAPREHADRERDVGPLAGSLSLLRLRSRSDQRGADKSAASRNMELSVELVRAHSHFSSGSNYVHRVDRRSSLRLREETLFVL